MMDGSQYPLFASSTFVLLYLPTTFEFIDGRYVVLCTWIVIIGLVNTICGVPTTLVFLVRSSKLLFKFLAIENSLNPWLKLIVDPITTPLLATFMLGTTTLSTHVLAITTLSDWITFILASCLRVSTITTFDTLGEAVLTLIRWCSNLWLPISILYGGECGCEYTSSFLLLIWIDGRICRLWSLNWLPNSMPLSLFWTILSSCSYGWSINALATFCNSTCLTILALMWKGIRWQSMIACLSSSHNAQIVENNLATFKSTYSWSLVSIIYLVWSNFRFCWCEYDYGTSSNTFTCAFAYLNDYR